MDPIEQDLLKCISDAKSFEELAYPLEVLISKGYDIWKDGHLYITKALVDRVDGLRIEIRPREHNPPHFHIRGSSIDASFTIEDGECLKGNIDSRTSHLIKWWYDNGGKLALIKIWNETRPTN
jgi:hypothetical protein